MNAIETTKFVLLRLSAGASGPACEILHDNKYTLACTVIIDETFFKDLHFIV